MAGSTIETRIKSEERGTGNSVSVKCINAPERMEGIYIRRRRNKLNEFDSLAMNVSMRVRGGLLLVPLDIGQI